MGSRVPSALGRGVLAVALGGLLLGCTDDGPDLRQTPAPDSFAAGECRDAAPDLAVLSEAADRLADDPDLAADTALAEQIRLAQERLRALQERLPDGSPLADPLLRVRTQTGFLRAALVSSTYQPERSQEVTDAVIATEQACNGG